MHIVNRPRKKSNGSSRSFSGRPAQGTLPRVEFGDSFIDVDPAPVRQTGATPRQSPPPARSDPLRLIGAASLGLGAVWLLLWLLGALLSTGGPAELQHFNAGRPVMLCTAGGYRPVDDSLLGRVFGERHFTCRDWKMGP